MGDDDFKAVSSATKTGGTAGDTFLYLAQLGLLLVFTMCTTYGPGVHPGTTGPNGEAVNLYPMF
jgi:hypothetical protein